MSLKKYGYTSFPLKVFLIKLYCLEKTWIYIKKRNSIVKLMLVNLWITIFSNGECAQVYLGLLLCSSLGSIVKMRQSKKLIRWKSIRNRQQKRKQQVLHFRRHNSTFWIICNFVLTWTKPALHAIYEALMSKLSRVWPLLWNFMFLKSHKVS